MLKRILSFCGACISFYIGAGFATMQEIVQYEASYGSRFPTVILVAALIYVYTNISFATNAHRLNLQRGGEIYGVYFSILGTRLKKYAAVFFDYFSALFCYMSFVVMCGGANSTLSQQWGIGNGVGAILLTIFVVLTVLFGLKGILRALSQIGPIIILTILVVSVITAVWGINDFLFNIIKIDDGEYVNLMKQVGDGNPFASGASYGGFVILWFAVFLAEIGAKNNVMEVNIGMLISTVFIFGTAAVCCIAIIGYIDITSFADIPALVLAQKISPILAQFFAVIIYAGIFTSAVPLLWTGVSKISKEGTRRYYVTTIIGGILGCIIACFVSYKWLINLLYGLNGYLGFILIFFMFIYDIRTKMSLNIRRKNK